MLHFPSGCQAPAREPAESKALLRNLTAEGENEEKFAPNCQEKGSRSLSYAGVPQRELGNEPSKFQGILKTKVGTAPGGSVAAGFSLGWPR